MVKGLTPTQLSKQLNTWSKSSYTDIYQDIMSLAEQSGILTKTGRVSKSQSKTAIKRREEFTRKYKEQFGSKTAYENKLRQQWKEQIKEGYTGTFKDFQKLSKLNRDYSKLVADLFNNFPSDDAYETYLYVETLDIEQAIEYLNNIIYGDNTNNDTELTTEPPFS